MARTETTLRRWTGYIVCLVSLAVFTFNLPAAERDGNVAALRVVKLTHHSELNPHRNVEIEQQMLTDFAAAEGMRIEWLTAASLRDLKTMLDDNRADISLTSTRLITASDGANSSVQTLAPIGLERFRVVGRRDSPLPNPYALANQRVAVKFSSPALPFLRALKTELDGLSLIILSDALPRDQVLAGLTDKRYDAVVIATNFTAQSLAGHPGLRYQFDLTELTPVSWEMPAGSAELKDSINQFLRRYHAAYIDPSSTQAQIYDVEKRGVIRAIAQLGENYFVKRGRPSGFDYDLMRRFADVHSLRLDVLVARDAQQAAHWLATGVGDIALSAIAADEQFVLSRAYRHEIGVVVTRAADTVRSVEALGGRRLAVIGSSNQHRQLMLNPLTEVDVVVLDSSTPLGRAVEHLRADEVDGIVVDSSEVSRVLNRHPDLSAGVSLPLDKHHRWTVRADDEQLALAVDEFIRTEYRKETYNMLARRYRKVRPKTLDPERLSPFDNLLRTYADIYSFDWRLIAAQMYQESRFDPNAVSDAGARGLMQIMPATASDLGLSDPDHPEASIRAGVKYLNELRNRFDDGVPEAERLWLALAAYNTGFERVKRAREYAKKLGLNPNRWFDHVEVAMRRMTRAKSPGMRCRCGQAIVYVRSIRSLYSAYRHLMPV